MHLEFPYGDRISTVEVDDHRVMAVLSPSEAPAPGETELISGAIRRPVASTSFEAFLLDAEDVLFVVNDATRPSPLERILDAVSPALKNRKIRFLVATGTHPPPDERDLRRLFGRHLQTHRECIEIHDANNESETTPVGTTRFGTAVRLNRRVVDARKLVVIGTVEPHYFAGYTGGRKSFLPGCAAYATVESNHRFALDPGSKTCMLEGNPVHEDMQSAAEMLGGKSVFSIQTVLDGKDRIVAAFAGSLDSSFRLAVAESRKVYCVPVPGSADVVIGAVSPPLDTDLYQAHKALENAKPAVKKGGIFILAAACPQGPGNDAFVRLLSSETRPQDVLRRVRKEYKLGYHKSARIAEFVLHSQCWAVTDLDPEIPRSMFMRPFAGLQAAVDEAIAQKPEGKILFIRSAGTVVPEIRGGREGPF
jgi:nickel-dependent lactate racemase